MKRGFLNTPRGKRVIECVEISEFDASRRGKSFADPSRGSRKAATIEEVPDGDDHVTIANDRTPKRDHKGKGKQKAVDTDDDVADDLEEAVEMIDEDPPSPEESYVMLHAIAIACGRYPSHIFLTGLLVSYFVGLRWDVWVGVVHPRKSFTTRSRNHTVDLTGNVPYSDNGRAIQTGKFLNATQNMGTLSPDSYPWGATLYDFFAVYRMPSIPGMVSFMTGSALLEATNAIGE
ncbi:hypothetical protein JVU11DRAFT_3102 [Chiua virens]|nr:hypothetical protein JVU11DRAFT_3102 [Chiua virens]